MDAHTRKALTRIAQCFLLFLAFGLSRISVQSMKYS